MSARARSQPIAGLAEAEAYLERLINVERRPDLPYERLGLDAVRALLGRLGDPQRGLAVVHLAGSKGKGSTALLVEALLREAGRRVGTFTSPHLTRWTERFRIDGGEVEGTALAAAVERLRPHVDALRCGSPASAPTFFDATTAAALLLFEEAKVDWVVLEVGLGGRLDSTNVAQPRVCCVTSVELEHTDRLGDTRAAIAGEKAGILKARVPAVLGPVSADAAAVVVARARALGAPLAQFGADFAVEVRERNALGMKLLYRDGPHRFEFELPVLGAHQATNAALALACVRRAGAVPDAELGELAARAFASVELPGRVELVGRRPWIVVDSAHTEESARALGAAIAPLASARTHFVLSISAGKDLRGILAAVLPLADEVTVTRAEAARSLGPREIAEAVRAAAPGLPLRVVPNPHLALRGARERAGEGDLVCATGSVYLAGIARTVFSSGDPTRRAVVSRSGGRGRSRADAANRLGR